MTKRKEIPRGLYCYEIIGSRKWNNIQIPKTKNCPYYECRDEELLGYCSLIKEEIEDQCKLCGTHD